MFCGSCGTALVKDDRFCRGCGAPAVEEYPETNGYPSSETATLVTAPAAEKTAVAPALFTAAPAAAVENKRPGWLIPLLGAAVLVLLAGVAAVILLSSRGGEKTAPLSEQAAPV